MEGGVWMSRLRRKLAVSFLVMMVLISSGCGGEGKPSSNPSSDPAPASHDRQSHTERDERKEREQSSHHQFRDVRPIEPTHQFRLMVVGDIMMHAPQIEAGLTEKGYDFAPFFEEVKPILQKADLAMGNLETTLGGPEKGYSGYPRFSSPDELIVALKEAGFDLLTTANNHALDTGADGLLRTIEQIEKAGLKRTGTFRSQKERDQPLVITHHHISLAVLAYTYGTNGIPIPEGKGYLVNLLDEELVKKDIEKARTMADFVAICVHFGDEYQTLPNESQKQWVDKMFQWGADLIFGSHPHVLQPYEQRRMEREGETREGLVIYSLGNFISNQRDEPRDIGGILDVILAKKGREKSINSVDFIPTYVHRYRDSKGLNFLVLPMEELLTVRDYPFLDEEDYRRLNQRYLKTLDHVVGASAKKKNHNNEE